MTTKQHTESRLKPGFSLCGKPMPYEATRWTSQESCVACARVRDSANVRMARQTRALSKSQIAADVRQFLASPRRDRGRARPDRGAPAILTSLTASQARWLRDARDTEGGAYVGLTAGPEPVELVEGSAAAFREVPRMGGTCGPRDPRPCEWTDTYLVPTAYGLDLLARSR